MAQLRGVRSCARLQVPHHRGLPSLPRNSPHCHSVHCIVPRSIATNALGTKDDSEPDWKAMAANLNSLMAKPGLSGKDLRQLVVSKWGRSFDVRLLKRDGRMYLQVMWKFLEQQSFHLTEQEYMAQLDAVAEYLTEWGVCDTVRTQIAAASSRGPGYTGGRGAKCISIPLQVDLSGARSGEWS